MSELTLVSDAVVHLFQSAACRARGENFRDCFFFKVGIWKFGITTVII